MFRRDMVVSPECEKEYIPARSGTRDVVWQCLYLFGYGSTRTRNKFLLLIFRPFFFLFEIFVKLYLEHYLLIKWRRNRVCKYYYGIRIKIKKN